MFYKKNRVLTPFAAGRTVARSATQLPGSPALGLVRLRRTNLIIVIISVWCHAGRAVSTQPIGSEAVEKKTTLRGVEFRSHPVGWVRLRRTNRLREPK